MAVYGVRAKREGERVNENRKQLLAVMVGLERGCVSGMLDAGEMVEEEFLKKSEWVGERGQIQNAASRAAGFVFENTGISKQNAWYYHALLAHQKIIESDKNRIRANPNVTMAWMNWIIFREEPAIHSICKEITRTTPRQEFEVIRSGKKKSGQVNNAGGRGKDVNKTPPELPEKWDVEHMHDYFLGLLSASERMFGTGPDKIADGFDSARKRFNV